MLHIKPNKINKEKLLNLRASFLNDDPHIWGDSYSNNDDDRSNNIVDNDNDVNKNDDDIGGCGIFDFLYN